MADIEVYDRQQAATAISTTWHILPSAQYDMLVNHLTLRLYKKDEIVYEKGKHPLQVYYLLRGKVKIYKDGFGRNQIVRAIKPGEFFGIRALFAEEEYKTGAMAIEDCQVAAIPCDILAQMMQANFHICHYFIHYLSVEIGKSDDRTVNLTQKHIRGRMAEGLMFLCDAYGLEQDGETLNIRLNREDLACLTNMTTSNCIRTLSAFAAEGLIATKGKSIRLIEQEKLEKISQQGD